MAWDRLQAQGDRVARRLPGELPGATAQSATSIASQFVPARRIYENKLRDQETGLSNLAVGCLWAIRTFAAAECSLRSAGCGYGMESQCGKVSPRQFHYQRKLGGHGACVSADACGYLRCREWHRAALRAISCGRRGPTRGFAAGG